MHMWVVTAMSVGVAVGRVVADGTQLPGLASCHSTSERVETWLQTLLNPVPTKEFFTQVWGKKPMLMRGAGPHAADKYRHLVPLDLLESLVDSQSKDDRRLQKG